MEVTADAVWKSIFAEVKLHFGRVSLKDRRHCAGLPQHFRVPHRACAPAGRADVTRALILTIGDRLNIDQDLIRA